MKSDLQNYDFSEHSHRYACWAAARAASVGRFSNKQIAAFINEAQLQQGVEQLRNEIGITHEIYKKWFLDKVQSIEELMNSFKKDKSDKKKKLRNISFGVAGKVVSVYVKTYEIIPEKGLSDLSKIAFPPVDSFLLRKLKKNGISGIKKTNWSKFDKDEYLRVIELLRNYKEGIPFWLLEKDWDVNDEDDMKKER